MKKILTKIPNLLAQTYYGIKLVSNSKNPTFLPNAYFDKFLLLRISFLLFDFVFVFGELTLCLGLPNIDSFIYILSPKIVPWFFFLITLKELNLFLEKCTYNCYITDSKRKGKQNFVLKRFFSNRRTFSIDSTYSDVY